MSSNITILKWLFALVLISEYGLFTSVVISVGFFHHWIIATEERRETEKMFQNILTKYIDGTVINATKRGFVGITNKELDFSEIMHGLYHGDYVYWLITFDPRYKHHCRELEHAIRKGVHFRMLILKDCAISELCASEIIGYGVDEFKQYNRLFLSSLQDIAGRIHDRADGTLGVFVYDGLPSIPLFIILRNTSKTVEIYNSFYLAEPVGRMPYLHWQSELKFNADYSFESANWNMPDLFSDYFQRRWYAEIKKLVQSGHENKEYGDFLYAPSSAKSKCMQLVNGVGNLERTDGLRL